jgi:uncharacterized protein
MQLRQLVARGLLAASILASVVSVATVQTQTARALSQDIVISQVYGGGGNSGATYNADFVELLNRGGAPVSITGWSIQYASATGTGNFGGNPVATLNGVMQPGQYYLVQLAGGAVGATLPITDAVGSANLSGTSGKVALVNVNTGLACNGGSTACSAAQLAQIVDLVGYGTANFFEVAAAGTLSATTAAIRNNNGCAETDNNAADFTVGAPAPRNSASPLNPCAGSPTSTPTATPTNTPEGPTPTPLPTDTPAPVCTGSITPIYAIQGSGTSAAITGTVTTRGVVIGDYELPTGITTTANYLRGFYLQDLTGDGDPATSDGIFVFNANNNSVSPGQVVEVTGTASEFQNQTQISAASVVQCNTSVVVTPVDVQLPVASSIALEQYEGMLVRLPQTLYVTEHFQLGRFGQVVLSVGGRQSNPTNIAAPGAPAQAVAAANALSRIILDDNFQLQNPDPIVYGGGSSPLAANNTLRGGDSVSGIVGVLGYTWAGNAASPNAYRVRPTQPVTFVAENPRPAAPANIGGNVRVGSFNVLNYFNTFDGRPDPAGNDLCAFGVGGAPADCRGADTAIEFDRQWPKTVAAINALNVDVLGIIEIENDGYGADSAIQDLVNKLNAASGPSTWAFINADANTGVVNVLGTDAIKVGFLYRPASVTPAGNTAVLNTGAFGPILLTSGQSQQRNRPALAQSFQHAASGERFTVVVNHLKSKGSACTDQVSPIGADPDTGDGQGNCNLTRTTAAQQLVTWLGTDPTGIGDPDVLIMGDLNAYAKEDPVTAIRNAGYTNLIETLLGPDAYSFAFDGTWGYLDRVAHQRRRAERARLQRRLQERRPADQPVLGRFLSLGRSRSGYRRTQPGRAAHADADLHADAAANRHADQYSYAGANRHRDSAADRHRDTATDQHSHSDTCLRLIWQL